MFITQDMCGYCRDRYMGIESLLEGRNQCPRCESARKHIESRGIRDYNLDRQMSQGMLQEESILPKMIYRCSACGEEGESVEEGEHGVVMKCTSCGVPFDQRNFPLVYFSGTLEEYRKAREEEISITDYTKISENFNKLHHLSGGSYNVYSVIREYYPGKPPDNSEEREQGEVAQDGGEGAGENAGENVHYLEFLKELNIDPSDITRAAREVNIRFIRNLLVKEEITEKLIAMAKYMAELSGDYIAKNLFGLAWGHIRMVFSGKDSPIGSFTHHWGAAFVPGERERDEKELFENLTPRLHTRIWDGNPTECMVLSVAVFANSLLAYECFGTSPFSMKMTQWILGLLSPPAYTNLRERAEEESRFLVDFSFMEAIWAAIQFSEIREEDGPLFKLGELANTVFYTYWKERDPENSLHKVIMVRYRQILFFLLGNHMGKMNLHGKMRKLFEEQMFEYIKNMAAEEQEEFLSEANFGYSPFYFLIAMYGPFYGINIIKHLQNSDVDMMHKIMAFVNILIMTDSFGAIRYYIEHPIKELDVTAAVYFFESLRVFIDVRQYMERMGVEGIGRDTIRETFKAGITTVKINSSQQFVFHDNLFRAMLSNGTASDAENFMDSLLRPTNVFKILEDTRREKEKRLRERSEWITKNRVRTEPVRTNLKLPVILLKLERTTLSILPKLNWGENLFLAFVHASGKTIYIGSNHKLELVDVLQALQQFFNMSVAFESYVIYTNVQQ